MIYAFISDKGLRKNNEDSFYIPDEGDRPVVIVADGMGGHVAGEVASSTAVDEVVDFIEYAEPGMNSITLLRQAVNAANRRVYEMATTDDRYNGMGTTLVMALLTPTKYTAANIGDSRLYHFDGTKLTRVTRDHSYVQELISAGLITEEQAKDHPQRNLITRVVGTSRFEKADVGIKSWKRGDILLLCSDGVCGVLDDSTIERVFRATGNLLEICDRLHALSLDNGSTDNITIVLVKNSEAENRD